MYLHPSFAPFWCNLSVWCSGFSGVLKNVVDLMGFDEFEGRMMGLVGVSGGRMGALAAMSLNVDRINSRLELNDS